MSFNFYLVKFLKLLLFPFSLIYGSVVIVRNYLFDKSIVKSASFSLPVIGVGNLSVGGTGKSPMVEYLVSLLHHKYQLATLSRGYKRKTKGYLLARPETTAQELGDEPMLFHTKFPNVAVAVGEERIMAIPQLLRDRPDTNVIILDDSFQHRWIKPGFNILLTEFGNLFTKDFFLPTGTLRDQKSSFKRANVIVVTKCPTGISDSETDKIKTSIQPLAGQHVFFTTLQYGVPYNIKTKVPQALSPDEDVLLVCGIANPEPLKNYLVKHSRQCFSHTFSDHHVFTAGDIKEITKKFNDINAARKIMVTTEKDAVKLLEFNDALSAMPLLVLPVHHRFLSGKGMQFDYHVNTFIETFQDK